MLRLVHSCMWARPGGRVAWHKDVIKISSVLHAPGKDVHNTSVHLHAALGNLSTAQLGFSALYPT